MKSVIYLTLFVSGVFGVQAGAAHAQSAEAAQSVEARMKVAVDQCLDSARAKNAADRKASVEKGMDPNSIFLVFDVIKERNRCQREVTTRFSTSRDVKTDAMGEWSVRETSLPDGTSRVSAVLRAERPDSGGSPSILMACADGETSVELNFRRMLDGFNENGRRWLSVQYEIGRSRAVTANYLAAYYDRVAVMTNNAEHFVASLHGETILDYSVKEKDGTPFSTRFNLAGVDAVVERIASACGYSDKL